MKKTTMKNCFIDEGIDFNYEISDENGEWIASAHAITPKDMSFIRSKAFGKTEIDENGQPQVDIDYFVYNVALIATCVDEWAFDRSITFDNVNLLKPEYIELIAKNILEKDELFKTNEEAIVKN